LVNDLLVLVEVESEISSRIDAKTLLDGLTVHFTDPMENVK